MAGGGGHHNIRNCFKWSQHQEICFFSYICVSYKLEVPTKSGNMCAHIIEAKEILE